jgi:hypothetical protein
VTAFVSGGARFGAGVTASLWSSIGAALAVDRWLE